MEQTQRSPSPDIQRPPSRRAYGTTYDHPNRTIVSATEYTTVTTMSDSGSVMMRRRLSIVRETSVSMDEERRHLEENPDTTPTALAHPPALDAADAPKQDDVAYPYQPQHRERESYSTNATLVESKDGSSETKAPRLDPPEGYDRHKDTVAATMPGLITAVMKTYRSSTEDVSSDVPQRSRSSTPDWLTPSTVIHTNENRSILNAAEDRVRPPGS